MRAGSIRRVAVIGRAGAGKTTYALRLGAALGLPVVHLDLLFWTTDWKQVPRAEFEAAQHTAVASERWVIDGGYLSSDVATDRLRRADLIVVAQAPLLVCLGRVIRRSLIRNGEHPDRAGAKEQLSPYFLWWIVTWNRRHPRLADSLRADGHQVVVLRRADDLERFLGAVQAAAN